MMRGPHGEWPLDRVEAAERLWREGWGARAVADRLGVTRNAVLGMAHRRKWVRGEPSLEVKELAAAQVAARRKVKPIVRRKVKSMNPGFVLVDKPPVKNRQPLRLVDLGHGQCKWPLSGTGADMLFCGKPRDNDSLSYCAEHQALGVQPTRPLRVRLR